MKRTSVACRTVADSQGNRVSGCGAGWWLDTVAPEAFVYGVPEGAAIDARCPRCRGPLVVTGTVTVVEVRRTCTICSAVLANPTSDERMSGLCMRCLWGEP